MRSVEAMARCTLGASYIVIRKRRRKNIGDER